MFINFPVNWSDSYRISYEFRTDMIVSRNGKEQRRALRTTPRKSLEYRSLATGDQLHYFNRLLSKWHYETLETHEATRFAIATGGMAASADTIQVASVPPWIVVDGKVALSFGRTVQLMEIAEITGTTLRFTANDLDWPAGTRVHPALIGNLSRQIRAPHRTNNTATVTINFDVEPASEAVVGIPAAPQTFKGRELFLTKPNWINDINWTYEHEIETVDYGRGRIARFLPVNFETNLFEATYLSRTSDDAEGMVNFFLRMLGQVGEFYMPTWNEDLKLRSTAFAGASTLRVRGGEVFEAYGTDTVHRAVAIFLRDGRSVFAKINAIFRVTDVVGDDSVLEMEDAWAFQIDPENVLMICWLPVWRHATDTLTIEWLSDSVAQTKLALKTLENLPVS